MQSYRDSSSSGWTTYKATVIIRRQSFPHSGDLSEKTRCEIEECLRNGSAIVSVQRWEIVDAATDIEAAETANSLTSRFASARPGSRTRSSAQPQTLASTAVPPSTPHTQQGEPWRAMVAVESTSPARTKLEIDSVTTTTPKAVSPSKRTHGVKNAQQQEADRQSKPQKRQKQQHEGTDSPQKGQDFGRLLSKLVEDGSKRFRADIAFRRTWAEGLDKLRPVEDVGTLQDAASTYSKYSEELTRHAWTAGLISNCATVCDLKSDKVRRSQLKKFVRCIFRLVNGLFPQFKGKAFLVLTALGALPKNKQVGERSVRYINQADIDTAVSVAVESLRDESGWHAIDMEFAFDPVRYLCGSPQLKEQYRCNLGLPHSLGATNPTSIPYHLASPASDEPVCSLRAAHDDEAATAATQLLHMHGNSPAFIAAETGYAREENAQFTVELEENFPPKVESAPEEGLDTHRGIQDLAANTAHPGQWNWPWDYGSLLNLGDCVWLPEYDGFLVSS